MSLTIKPNTTTVTLLQGDDLDPINSHAEEAQRIAATAAPSRLNDDVPEAVAKSLKAYDEFMDEVEERAVKVKMTALPRKAYRALLNAHPPRTVETPNGPTPHDEDEGWGFNRETFGDAVAPPCVELGLLNLDDDLAAANAIAAQIIEGTYKPSDEVSAFLDSLSDGWFAKIYSAAVSLNQSAGPNPKVRLSSHIDPTSDETSQSPVRLA